MPKRILILNGHPDGSSSRFIHALTLAYAEGARIGGHAIRVWRLADINPQPLRDAQDFAAPPTEPALSAIRNDWEWANHVALLFPLWLGGMPARLHALFEQIARGGFVAEIDAKGWRPHLKGKSARIIVTMGMPAFAYRLVFGGHGVKRLERSILGFAGMGPLRETLIGGVEALGAAGRARWLARVRNIGQAGV
ncbi:MAG: NAD(P)H-dependent oxidoreductase [Hyphomonadaceae bacterium]